MTEYLGERLRQRVSDRARQTMPNRAMAGSQTGFRGMGAVLRLQRNTGADASAVSTTGIASAAATVWNAVMPAISGASPPSWRAMM